MKNRLLLLIAAGAVLFGSSKLHAQNFLKVTRTNQEQTITLSTDQVLEIQLPRRSSNGYIWVEAPAPNEKSVKSIAKIGDDDFIHDLVSGKVMRGGSGNQIMRYVGTSQGTTTLTLELKRPWSKDKEVIDSYTITVVSNGKYTGTYTPPLKATKHYDKPLTLTPLAGIPSSWDWRSKCTPVANQMQCGDCWAFATVGTLECNISITDGVTRDISEEFVTNCYSPSSNFDGCDGESTTVGAAHQVWLASYTGANSSGGGAVYETEDPWTTAEGNGASAYPNACGGPYAPHETITSFRDIGGEDANQVPSVDSMQYFIYNDGPIWIGMDAASTNFNNYSGKILVESGTSPDHCVVLVGWKDTTVSDNSGGYWILRNSWGTDWGVNKTGYMYISYGSDVVGNMADFLVYKGGTSHNAPPVASFSASATTSCTSGTVQFTDQSTNTPTTWSWNFGDGTTSATQSPLHTYASNGTYTVSLTATNSYGTNTDTQTSYITIDMPPSPTVTAGCYSPSTVPMTANGTGTLNWYSSPSSTTVLHTGTSYTPTVTSATDYYVQNSVAGSAQSAGVATSTLSTGSYTNAAREGLKFNADVPLVIKSVMVYEQTAGNRTFVVKNSSGTEIDSLTTSVSTGSQTVTLNFSIPTGTGYILESPGSSAFWRDNSASPTYPFSIANVISITGCTNTTHTGYYYYYYDWQIETYCLSPMTEVSWGICTGINEFSENNNFNIFPNPNSGSFDIKLTDQNIQNATLSVANMLGQTVLEKRIMDNNSQIHVDVANLQPGMYYVKIKTENATYIRKMLITVN
jgi:PKD repeat protein